MPRASCPNQNSCSLFRVPPTNIRIRFFKLKMNSKSLFSLHAVFSQRRLAKHVVFSNTYHLCRMANIHFATYYVVHTIQVVQFAASYRLYRHLIDDVFPSIQVGIFGTFCKKFMYAFLFKNNYRTNLYSIDARTITIFLIFNYAAIISKVVCHFKQRFMQQRLHQSESLLLLLFPLFSFSVFAFHLLAKYELYFITFSLFQQCKHW